MHTPIFFLQACALLPHGSLAHSHTHSRRHGPLRTVCAGCLLVRGHSVNLPARFSANRPDSIGSWYHNGNVTLPARFRTQSARSTLKFTDPTTDTQPGRVFRFCQAPPFWLFAGPVTRDATSVRFGSRKHRCESGETALLLARRERHARKK